MGLFTMMNKKEILSNAISKNDISLIEDYYELIYDEKPPEKPPLETSGGYIKKRVDELVDLVLSLQDEVYGNVDKYEEVDIGKTAKEELDEPEIPNTTKEEPDFSTSDDGANENIRVEFISSKNFKLPEDDWDNYEEAIREQGAKMTRNTRDAYVPDMKRCSSCNTSFDYNKEYPVGTIDSSRGLKCNKCRTLSSK